MASLARLDAQPRLQRRERTSQPGPGLQNDDGDGRQMGKPEPKLIDPKPALHIAIDDQRQSNNDEARHACVQDKYRICEGAVHGG